MNSTKSFDKQNDTDSRSNRTVVEDGWRTAFGDKSEAELDTAGSARGSRLSVTSNQIDDLLEA